jgi:catechol 2,3-dioxygenase-like lactoylglutathione lyase family enzyme
MSAVMSPEQSQSAADAAPQATGKLRHIALTVPDPWKAAEFYMKAFGMHKVAVGVYLSDGVINLALLNYKTDEAAGEDRGRDFFGIHHIGFWVEDAHKSREAIEGAGGSWFMGDVAAGNTFYEVKFRDPNGVIFDITANGWGGASKDGTPNAKSPGLRHADLVADRSHLKR